MESGLEIPSIGYKLFMIRPINIKKKQLKPTEYNPHSLIDSLSNLRIPKMIRPGKKAMQIKPQNCIKKEGILKPAKSIKCKSISRKTDMITDHKK